MDFNYLSQTIESWWKGTEKTESFLKLKIQFQNLLINNIKNEDFYHFDKIGLAKYHISAVCVKNIFNTVSEKLAYIAHEAISELFKLNDLKYPYEDHKLLYLKPSGIHYEEWGNGMGKITPHSDDLYENIDTDFLSLTVCKDQIEKPTKCYFPKDFLETLTNEELGELTTIKAKFISGKNVNGLLIEKERDIIEINAKFGVTFNLDFRTDTDNGERMLVANSRGKFLLDKIRRNITTCRYYTSVPHTGNFFMLANHKVLHARDAMNSKNVSFKHIPEKISHIPPRLLYRSKGPRVSSDFDAINK